MIVVMIRQRVYHFPAQFDDSPEIKKERKKGVAE